MAGCAGVLLWAVIWCCGSEGVLLSWEVCWLGCSCSGALCHGASRASSLAVAEFRGRKLVTPSVCALTILVVP